MIRFATRFRDPAGSPIRELFPYLSRPGIISFAGGYPSPAVLDARGLGEAAAQVFTSDASILQYGATEGHPRLREELLRLGCARGIQSVAHDELLVTTGSQQAFDLLVRVLVEPGDVVLLEAPAYPAAIQSLRLAGATLMQVPMDSQGLDTDALASLLRDAPRTAKPRLLYTIPNFSNPRGSLLSDARRCELLDLAQRHRLLLVEDDPYGELSFDGRIPDTLYARAKRAWGKASPVVYLSSLSKTVAPALRIGWMIGPADVVRRCAIAKQTVDLCTPPISQLVAAQYLRSGRYPDVVAAARAEYARRVEAMAAGLARELRGLIHFEQPRGGMFVWIDCDPDVDPGALFDAAVEQGVLFVPGAAFYASPPPRTGMRLSFAAPDVAAIDEGVRRLARAFHASLISTANPS